MVSLPNPERAVVDVDKLVRYALNPVHPTGRHKARVFAASLGLTAAHAKVLADALKSAAATESAVLLRMDGYGAHYRLEFMMSHNDRRRLVRSLWIVRSGEDYPRLVSVFVAPGN